MLILEIVQIYLWWHSHVFIHDLVNNHTWSCITMLIFTLGHVSPCWYSHLAMYLHVFKHMWSCIPMIFTLGHVLPCCYYQLVMCPHFDIQTWSGVFSLILIFHHGSLLWNSHLTMWPHIDVLVIYFSVDCHISSYITMLILTVDHV